MGIVTDESIYFSAWYSIIKQVYNAFVVTDSKIGAVARTTAEKKKAEDLKRTSKGVSVLKSKPFLFNLGLTLFFSAIFCWLLVMVQQDGEVNSFDPFGILEVEPGSDAKTIKKDGRKQLKKAHKTQKRH